MRRFYVSFQIPQPVAVESLSPAIPQPPAVESGRVSLPKRVDRTRPTLSDELSERLAIDFAKHSHLGWTHYRILLSTGESRQRRFYFEQACNQRWSKRELQRQIAGALFERVALSSDTRALVKLEKQKGPPEVTHYREAFKDPYLLDFLGLTGACSERDLEAAIIRNLQQFLTELGSDFCFIRRQYPMRVDDATFGGGRRSAK